MYKLNYILAIIAFIATALFIVPIFSPSKKEYFSESYYSCINQSFPRDFCLHVPFQSKL
jgi:hypothetical protein